VVPFMALQASYWLLYLLNACAVVVNSEAISYGPVSSVDISKR